jgi:hypothetical protein
MGAIDRLGSTYEYKRLAAGTYVDGKWIEGAEIIGTIVASIQPLTPQETQTLPEGERSSEFIRIYTATKINKVNEAAMTKGDKITYNGRDYEVKKVEDWTAYRIPHYKAIAVLLEEQTGG